MSSSLQEHRCMWSRLVSKHLQLAVFCTPFISQAVGLISMEVKDSSRKAQVCACFILDWGPIWIRQPQCWQVYIKDLSQLLPLQNGSLPAAWASPNHFGAIMRNLNIANNSLTGEVPEAWGSLARAAYSMTLSLFDNELAGSIPSSFTDNGAFPNSRRAWRHIVRVQIKACASSSCSATHVDRLYSFQPTRIESICYCSHLLMLCRSAIIPYIRLQH